MVPLVSDPAILKKLFADPPLIKLPSFLHALTTFANLLAAGCIQSNVTLYHYGMTLLTSKKKSGGHRRKVVGEVLRRLVSRCLSLHSCVAINSLLIPLQLGVRVHGGCEAIVHAMSRLSTSLTYDRCWTLILDFTNAFNSNSRQAMFESF